MMKIRKDFYKNKSKDNKSIMIIAVIVMIIYLVMCINIFVFVKYQSYNVISSSYNPRQSLLAKQNIRGSIYSCDGNLLAMTGYDEAEKEVRSYPYDELFCHVVGYSTYGTSGIEKAANMKLVTSSMNVNDKVSNDINGLKNTGDSIYTTLDPDIQAVADKYLGAYKGAVVVSDVKTGKIIAMVSKPGFDPNVIDKQWDEISQNNKEGVLVNRATQGLYPPGSTFKIIDLLEYIRENPNDYENYDYQCNGKYKYDMGKITCYHGTKHGAIDLKTSFAKSCNCSFANIGMSVDKEKMSDTLSECLFNRELPIDIIYNKSKVTFDETCSEAEVVQNSIGQGSNVMTPLHLNLITNAIANNGILMKPYLIDYVENVEGDLIKSFEAEKYSNMMTEREAEILREYMGYVVTEGTGRELKNADYSSGGKTGSAEYGNQKGDSHAWFTGFAPLEEPQISVTVIVEGAGSGGESAVPIAKKVFDTYFEKYGIGNF